MKDVQQGPHKPLTRERVPGDHVFWTTLNGNEYEGRLKGWDNWTAIIELDNGREVAVAS